MKIIYISLQSGMNIKFGKIDKSGVFDNYYSYIERDNHEFYINF